MPYRRPQIEDIYAAPDRAILAMLEVAADVTLIAVIAAHPADDELDDDPAHPERAAARALTTTLRDDMSAARTERAAHHRWCGGRSDSPWRQQMAESIE